MADEIKIIELPDGQRIPVPADATPEEMNRAAANAYMKAKSRGFGERALDAVGTGVNYLGTRITDAATGLLGLPRMIGDISAAGDAERPEPQGAVGRAAKRVHEAIDPMQFFRMAPSAQQMRDKVYGDWGVPRQDSGSRVLDAATEGAVLAPFLGPAGAFSTPGLMAGGAAGGAVSEMAGQATEGTPWEIPARLFGGFAGGAGAAAAPAVMQQGARAVTAVARPLTATGREGLARDMIARAAGKTPQEIEGAIKLPATPGAPATLAEATQLPGVAGLERTVRFKPDYMPEFIAADEAANAARRAAVDKLKLGDKAANLQTQADDAVAAVGYGQEPWRAGDAIRQRFDERYQASRKAVSDAYKRGEDAGAAVGPQAAYTRAAAFASERYGPGSAGMPDEIAAMLRDLRGENLPLATLERIRQRAGDAANRAALTGDRTQASVAGEIRRAVDEAIDMAPAVGQADAAAVAELRQARQLRREQGENFEGRVSGKLSDRGDYVRPNIEDSQVPGIYFNAGKTAKEDAAAFRKAFSDDPQAQQAIEQYAIRQFREAAAPGGRVDPTKAGRWIADHADALELTPDLRNNLQALASVASRNSAGSAAVRQILDAMEKGNAYDAQGAHVFTNAAFNDALKRARPNLKLAGLSSEEIATLEGVASDLRRRAYVQQVGTGRNSTSLQHVFTDQLVRDVAGNRVGGSGLARSIATPFMTAAYRWTDAQREIENIVAEALRDPEAFRRLLAARQVMVPPPPRVGPAMSGAGTAGALIGAQGGRR